MKWLFIPMLFIFIAGCTEKYPLHKNLRKEFTKVKNNHDHFYKIVYGDNNSDTIFLSEEEFEEEVSTFLKLFPKVDDMEGSPEKQNHKYMGKIKFLFYEFETPKDQKAKVHIKFAVKENDREVLESASYYLTKKDDRNPTTTIQLHFTSNNFKILNAKEYYTVEWE